MTLFNLDCIFELFFHFFKMNLNWINFRNCLSALRICFFVFIALTLNKKIFKNVSDLVIKFDNKKEFIFEYRKKSEKG